VQGRDVVTRIRVIVAIVVALAISAGVVMIRRGGDHPQQGALIFVLSSSYPGVSAGVSPT
jgi:hypothetical protein